MASPVGSTSSKPINDEALLSDAVTASGAPVVSPGAKAGPTEPAHPTGPQRNHTAPYAGSPSPQPEATTSEGLSKSVQGALTSARRLLESDVTRLDLMVTESEAKQALAALAPLDKKDFAAAVQELSSSGHLATMVEKLPWEDQCRFLELAQEKGLVRRASGELAQGVAQPPAPPSHYLHDAKLPREVNDLIHEHSRVLVSQYKQEYGEYLERFCALIDAAKTYAELRALGEPASGHTTWELCDYQDPMTDRYNRDWSASDGCSATRAYRALSSRKAELEGERADGSMWVEGKLEVQLDDLSAEINYAFPPKPGETSANSVKVGYREKKPLPGGRLPMPVEHSVRARSDGSVEVKVATNRSAVPALANKPETEVKVVTDLKGNVTEAAVDPGPVGVAYDAKKGVGVRVTVSKSANHELGSKAFVNPTTAELRGGAYGKLKASESGVKVELKGEGNVVVKGIPPKHAAQSLAHLTGNREGFWSRPAELIDGVPWSSLSPQRREFLEGLGWTEDEWTKPKAEGSHQ